MRALVLGVESGAGLVARSPIENTGDRTLRTPAVHIGSFTPVNISMNYAEFDDFTPHVEASATIDEHGNVTDESISIKLFGDHGERIRAGIPQPLPSYIIMSVEEAEVLVSLLHEAVTDARKGRYNNIDKE